jgi:peptidoglycan/LPS O-acetylase OafA/YrhL
VHLFVLNANVYDLLKSFFIGLFYAHFIIFGHPNPINPVTWSLETEAQFYILVPFILYILCSFKNKLFGFLTFCVLLFSSVVAKKWIMDSNFSFLKGSLLVYLINFLVGIVLAYLYLSKISFFKSKNNLWDLISIFAFFGLFYFYKPQNNFVNIIMLNLSIFVFILSIFKGKVTNWFYTQPIVYTIGGMCYSIYLLHYAFFHLSVKLTSKLNYFTNYKLNLLTQIIINIPLIIAISAMFFVLIEKPCMNKDWYKKISIKIISD